MKFLFRVWLFTLALLMAISAGAQGVPDQMQPEPPMLGIHWAKDHPAILGVGSPDMTWHGGAVMPTADVSAIFWGTSWGSYNGDKITGMARWYEGFDSSDYAKTSDEYKGSNGQVTASVSYGGHYVDATKAKGGGSISGILAEVCKVIPKPVSNGYYAVYTDIPRGTAGYCAYHSAGFCGGTLVQFAFFWNLDGDSGCNPRSGVAGESEGLAALANSSGHELSEARTDPSGGGWYDSAVQENGDKCAWSFNVPYVTFTNGSKWKIQGEWSNKAYNSGTGYPNKQGLKGCLDGH
jgi:hypothetical protein